MRLEDMLKDISGMTNQVIKTNCFEGQNTLLESILLIQTKVNEVIQAINDGIIKGDKGDKGDTGETGAKGDKGDTGKASESIQDDVISLDTCYSSEKTVSLFNDLKNIQGVKYGNDVGYQICKGTHNGIVKDIKVYGKSLVNKSKIKTTSFEGRIINLFSNNGTLNGFTIVADVTKNTTSNGIALSLTDADGIITNPLLQDGNTVGKVICYFNKKIKDISIYQQLDDYGADKAIVDNIIILEGDHRSNLPNGYFEGIASVGNGNEIEVLSSDNGNLFDGEFIRGTINGVDGTLIPQDNIYNVATKNIIKVVPNIMVNYKSIGSRGFRQGKNVSSYYYDKNNVLVAKMLVNTFEPITIPNNCYGIRLVFADFELATNQPLNSYNIILNQIGTLDNPNFAKQDKKTILFKDTDNIWKPITNLNGIPDGTTDIVDTIHNRYYKNTTRMVLAEGNYRLNASVPTNDDGSLCRVSVGVDKKIFKDFSTDLVCNKFKVIPQNELINWEPNTICPDGWNDSLHITVPITYLASLDYAGAKKFINEYGIEVVFPSLNPVEYEINPIYPESYVDETMVLFNTGVIPCKNEFYIDSNLGSLQLETLDRLSKIEDTIYKSNVALLRGDFRTLAEMCYPKDFIKEEELINE